MLHSVSLTLFVCPTFCFIFILVFFWITKNFTTTSHNPSKYPNCSYFLHSQYMYFGHHIPHYLCQLWFLKDYSWLTLLQFNIFLRYVHFSKLFNEDYIPTLKNSSLLGFVPFHFSAITFGMRCKNISIKNLRSSYYNNEVAFNSTATTWCYGTLKSS